MLLDIQKHFKHTPGGLAGHSKLKKKKKKNIYLGEASKASRGLFEKFLNVKEHFVRSETLQISV